jgi:hypothetical protein
VSRYEIIERERPGDARTRYGVLDKENDIIVSNFDTRDDARAHIERLEQGPFDLDEQENWKEDDDWGTWEKWD